MKAQRILIVGVLACLMALAAAAPVGRDEFDLVKARVEQLEREMDQVKDRLQATEAKLKDLERTGVPQRTTTATPPQVIEDGERADDSEQLAGREFEAWEVARDTAQREFRDWADDQLARAGARGERAPGLYMKTKESTKRYMEILPDGQYVFSFPAGYAKGRERTLELYFVVRVTDEDGELKATGVKKVKPTEMLNR